MPVSGVRKTPGQSVPERTHPKQSAWKTSGQPKPVIFLMAAANREKCRPDPLPPSTLRLGKGSQSLSERRAFVLLLDRVDHLPQPSEKIMNARKVLFATDFSDASQSALKYAEMLARDTKALLLIVHVQERVIHYNLGDMQLPLDEPNPESAERLKAVVPSDLSVAFEHRLVLGLPADEILSLAESEHVDLIIMGTHGRTGLTRLLMGSVAEAVVRRAPCPVFTLRQRRHEPSLTT